MMVSTPNTQGLYGNAAQGAEQAGPYKDPNEERNMGQVGADWKAYQDRVAAEKKAAEEAAAAEAARKAAATSDEAYAQSLEAWKAKRNDWTGGQTHFSNPYQIPLLQAAAIKNAGAAPAATTATQRLMLANVMAGLSGPARGTFGYSTQVGSQSGHR